MKVSKLEAAKRQLRTAIALWFKDGEPVSIHTLAFAAHQIIHDLNAKNKGEPLLYDSDWIKDEYRRQANDLIRQPGNFFKHAGVKPDAHVEFNPRLTEGFFLFSIRGLQQLGVKQHVIENAFLRYSALHKPQLLSAKGRKFLFESLPIEHIEHLRSFTKLQFLEAFAHTEGIAIPIG